MRLQLLDSEIFILILAQRCNNHLPCLVRQYVLCFYFYSALKNSNGDLGLLGFVSTALENNDEGDFWLLWQVVLH